MRDAAKRIARLAIRWPAYPMIFAVAQTFAMYADTAASIVAVVRPLLLTVGSIVVVVILAGVAMQSIHRGALVGAIFVLLLRGSEPGQAAMALAILGGGLLLIVFVLHLRRVTEPAAVVTRLLNTFGAALFAVVVVNIGLAGKFGEIARDVPHGMSMVELASRASAEPLTDERRRDVYLILLDGYPRSDTLRRLFAFDNSDFESALRSRGFAVAGGSRSNYMYTALTLTSMLHMKHVSDIPTVTDGASLRVHINHNPTFDLFRDRGYLVVAASAGWESDAMRSADVFCGDDLINDFELNIVDRSVIGRLVQVPWPTLIADRDRGAIDTAISCVSDVAAVPLDQPRFMVAHVPSPHLPIVFDRDGQPADPVLYGHTAQELSVSREEFQRGYVDSIIYLNNRVLAAIDDVLASSRTPPIIVLMSDHGSESRLNWKNALLSDMEERFSTLFAARTPGLPDPFGDYPTPVNVFPVLFNSYFGTTILLASDAAFVSPVQDRLALSPAPGSSVR